MDDKITFIFIGCLFFIFIGCAVVFGNNYNLDRIKSKTVGDGQHGTASFATQREINNTFKKISMRINGEIELICQSIRDWLLEHRSNSIKRPVILILMIFIYL